MWGCDRKPLKHLGTRDIYYEMSDPFLWKEFNEVWDNAVALLGRTPTDQEYFTGEISHFFDIRSKEACEKWVKHQLEDDTMHELE